MKKLFKRTVGATVATAIVAVTPLLLATPASAAPTNGGPAVLKTANNGGPLTGVTDANDPWTIRLDAGGYVDGPDAGTTADANGACQSDGNNGGRAHTYIIPANEAPSTLLFAGNGGLANQSAGTGGTGTFRNNLFTTGGSAARTLGLATNDATIINIPNLHFNVQTAGQIPSGAYNVGIACIDLDEPTGANYAPNNYFNKVITVTYPSGDASGAQITFVPGAVIDPPPAITGVTPGTNTASVAFTAPAGDPAATGYTVTATSGVGGAITPVAASGASSPITVTGLSASTLYSFTVTATNPVGTSAASSAVTATTLNNGAVQNLAQSPAPTPGGTTVSLDWDAPAGAIPTGYDVTINTTFGAVNVTGTSATITNVPVGVHSCTVTPTHDAPALGTPASIACSIVPNTLIIQEITVTRPVGALVITQKCGATGTAPLTGPGGTGIADPRFVDYPYPVDANGVVNATYPTYCGVSLGTAKLITSGTGAGQFFRATGDLAEVTVVDTRDSDLGWTVNGTMANFLASAGDSFSGSQLGWTPAAPVTTPTYTDSLGNSYTQLVNAGAAVAPNTAAASGLSSGRPLAIAPTGTATGGGLGIAVLEAGLELLIPVTANNGNYTGVLTLTVA